MRENIADLGARNVNEIQSINRDLIEKALEMRCVSYLSQVKAGLLTETIYEIDSSKKHLQQRTDELVHKQSVILRQKQELEIKNRELQEVRNQLDRTVSERTDQLGQTVRKLQESEERYHTLFRSSQSVMLLIDPENGAIEDVNDAAAAFYGYSRDELTAKKITDLNILEKNKVFEEMKNARSKRNNHFFFRHRLNSGELRNVEVYSSPVRLNGRELLYSIVHDITNRKKTENALRESEDKASALLNAITEVAFLIDTDGNFIALNPVAAGMIDNRSPEELIGTCSYDYIPPGLAKLREAVVKRIMKTKESERFLDRHCGTLLDTSLYPMLDEEGNVKRLAVFARDITLEKSAEKQLRDNQRFLNSIFNSIQDGISVLNRDLEIVLCNDAVETMFQDQLPLSGKTCYEVYRHRESPCKICPTQRAIDNRRLETEEVSFIRHGGEGGLLEVYAFPMFDENDKVVGVVECLRDITEKRLMEKALRESELQQKEAVSAANVGLWDWHLATNKVHYSPEWKRQVGYEEHEIPDDFNEWRKRVHPEDIHHVFEAIERFCSGDLPEFQVEFRFRHKDGSYRWILAQASLIKDEQGMPVRMVGSHLDITDRVLSEKKIEASLREKEVLLREVHHRVKNNLAVIISLLNLQTKQSKDNDTASALKDSRDRVRSMALIHEALYQSENFSEISLKDYIQTLSNRLLQAIRTKDIQVRMDFDIEDIRLDLDQAIPFGLILNELITNALKYAFPDGKGVIRVAMRTVDPYEIQLIVHDNGIGLPENEKLSDIEALGLNIVSTLVEGQLEGRLDVSNENGARFAIRWPTGNNSRGGG